MAGQCKRDYVIRHEQIKNKLIQMSKECSYGCFPVSRIASELGMDQRTVRAHLRIIEANSAGVFVDPGEKSFCTREGIIQLANKIGLKEIPAGDRQNTSPVKNI